MPVKLRVILSVTAFVILLFGSGLARASSLAFDSAADPAYNGGWGNGSNGGYGWGSGWQFFGPGGFIIGTSTTNGVGDPGWDGDIDTDGRSWGELTSVDPHSDSVADATRAFSGALSIGQSFTINMDNGIEYGGSPLAASSSVRLGNQFGTAFTLAVQINTNFSTYYVIGDATGSHVLPLALTDQGLHIVFALTSSKNYEFSVSGAGTDAPSGLPYVFSGILDDSLGTNITSVSLVSENSGTNPANWNFFNDMAIVPEPSALLLVGLALPLALLLRRNKSLNETVRGPCKVSTMV